MRAPRPEARLAAPRPALTPAASCPCCSWLLAWAPLLLARRPVRQQRLSACLASPASAPAAALLCPGLLHLLPLPLRRCGAWAEALLQPAAPPALQLAPAPPQQQSGCCGAALGPALAAPARRPPAPRLPQSLAQPPCLLQLPRAHQLVPPPLVLPPRDAPRQQRQRSASCRAGCWEQSRSPALPLLAPRQQRQQQGCAVCRAWCWVRSRPSLALPAAAPAHPPRLLQACCGSCAWCLEPTQPPPPVLLGTAEGQPGWRHPQRPCSCSCLAAQSMPAPPPPPPERRQLPQQPCPCCASSRLPPLWRRQRRRSSCGGWCWAQQRPSQPHQPPLAARQAGREWGLLLPWGLRRPLAAQLPPLPPLPGLLAPAGRALGWRACQQHHPRPCHPLPPAPAAQRRRRRRVAPPRQRALAAAVESPPPAHPGTPHQARLPCPAPRAWLPPARLDLQLLPLERWWHYRPPRLPGGAGRAGWRQGQPPERLHTQHSQHTQPR